MVGVYAVVGGARGVTTTVNNWEACRALVHGVSKAQYKKFATTQDALDWISKLTAHGAHPDGEADAPAADMGVGDNAFLPAVRPAASAAATASRSSAGARDLASWQRELTSRDNDDGYSLASGTSRRSAVSARAVAVSDATKRKREDDEKPKLPEVDVDGPAARAPGFTGAAPNSVIRVPQIAPFASQGHHVVLFDGASKGNPGKSGAGYLVLNPSGRPVTKVSRFVGDRSTNNEAEFLAAIWGMQAAKQAGATRICVAGDSNLVIQALLGGFTIKAANLVGLAKQAVEEFVAFESHAAVHIPRALNADADSLANVAVATAKTLNHK